MNQAKDWYRWAFEKKRNARARGETGFATRTMGRRGLAGNVGQPNAREIAQAVYNENIAAINAASGIAEETENENEDEDPVSPEEVNIIQVNNPKRYNTLAGYPTISTARSNPPVIARNKPIFALPTSGGRSRRARKTRKARKSSRRARTRAHKH